MSSLDSWLTLLRSFPKANTLLEELGVQVAGDLLELDDEDIWALGKKLKKVQRKQLERELRKSRGGGPQLARPELDNSRRQQVLDDEGPHPLLPSRGLDDEGPHPLLPSRGLDDEGPHPLLGGGQNVNSDTMSGQPAAWELGRPASSSDHGTDTPLHEAARKGDFATVQRELAAGSNIQALGDDGWLPVHSAAAGGLPRILEAIVEQAAKQSLKVDFNARVPGTEVTPLSMAAEAGHKEMVTWLLSHGADREAADSDGWTPLLSASQNGHVAVAELLLREGANPLACSSEGQSCLALACQNGHRRLAKALFKAGLDPNYGAKTPLISAAGDGQHEIVEWLVETAGADKDLAGSDGMTPLRCAMMHGHGDVVKALIRLKARDSGPQGQPELRRSRL